MYVCIYSDGMLRRILLVNSHSLGQLNGWNMKMKCLKLSFPSKIIVLMKY